MRKTSMMWRVAARGLLRVLIARFVVMAVVLAVGLAVVMVELLAVVMAELLTVVMAEFLAVVMVVVWMVSEIVGRAGVRIALVIVCSRLTDDTKAVRLMTLKTCRSTVVKSSDSGTFHVV